LVIPHLPGRLVAPAIPIGPLVFSIIPHVTGGTLASVEPKIERAVCDRHRDLGSHDPQFVGLPAAIEGHKADQRGRSLHNGDQRSQLAESVATRGKNLGTGEYRTYPEMINGYRCTDRDVLNGNPTATREVVSGSLLVYESKGAAKGVQRYVFRYVVRGGEIVSGEQSLVSGGPPRGC
jgi:hypothetical protein